ncbi:MAG: cytochrome c [Bacteroidetes bacterium]|nr:cytochrome c [Bacteroidota bacterium]
MHKLNIAILASLIFLVVACQQPGTDSTGSEYMPDMGHSIAYEANVYNYYYLNTWDSASVVKLKPMSMPRKPVDGTIPRGWSGTASDHAGSLTSSPGEEGVSIPLNGHVPYYYENTEEERLRATAEIIANPFPITDEGMARAEDLYNIYCGICHGEKGDGAGYIVRDDGGKYPAQPANFLLEEFVNASNGRYYHAIMYGKNVMGGYADKLSFEERWQVIHYIRGLQASELDMEYSETANTLNPSFGTPMASMAPIASKEEMSEDEMHEGEEAHGDDEHMDEGGDAHSDEDHGDEHH